MKKPVLLFIQGGGEGGYEADKQLALYLQNALVIFGRGHQLNNDLTEIVQDIKNLG